MLVAALEAKNIESKKGFSYSYLREFVCTAQSRRAGLAAKQASNRYLTARGIVNHVFDNTARRTGSSELAQTVANQTREAR